MRLPWLRRRDDRRADAKTEVARTLRKQRRFQEKHASYEGSNEPGGGGDLGHGYGPFGA